MIINAVSMVPADVAHMSLGNWTPRASPLRGTPMEAMSTLFDDGLVATGVWEATPGRFPATRGASRSLMYILSGKGVLEDSDGTLTDVRPGSVIVEPEGWSGYWDIEETVRKFFIIVRSP